MPKMYNLLSLDIEEQVKQYIDKHNLQPGDKLPSERDFSTMLNVTRVTLRHALEVLISEGSIERHPGSGYYLCPPKTDRELLYYCFPYKDCTLINEGYTTEKISFIPEQIRNIAANSALPTAFADLVSNYVLESVAGRPIGLTYMFQQPESTSLFPYLFEMNDIPDELTITQTIRIFPYEENLVEPLHLTSADSLLLISNFVHYRSQTIGISLSLCVGNRVNLITSITLPE